MHAARRANRLAGEPASVPNAHSVVEAAMLSRWIAALLICSCPASALAQSQPRLRLPPAATFTMAQSAMSAPANWKPKSARRDSVKNGAIIGAVIAGTYCAFVCGQGLDRSSQLPLAVAAAAGFGALIGASIDAGMSRKPGIFFRKRW
jgi:hypothetical protein